MQEIGILPRPPSQGSCLGGWNAWSINRWILFVNLFAPLLCGWLSGIIIHNCWDHRSLVLFCFFANLSVDIDRRPIFLSTVDIDRRPIFFVWIDLDGRNRPIFGYCQSNRPSISTVILFKCNRTDRRYRPCSPVGAIEPTVDIDRDWPTGRIKSTDRWNRRHKCNVAQSWNQIQTLKNDIFCHIYCAHLCTLEHQIVGGICTVPNRESQYPRYNYVIW